jgi:hypothetical protein
MQSKFHNLTLIILTLLLFSCAQKQESKDEIVKAAVTNEKGQTLKETFNNTKGTLELEFEGEKIFLKRALYASGVRCVNDHYEYINWHGETILKKVSVTIFYDKGEKSGQRN